MRHQIKVFYQTKQPHPNPFYIVTDDEICESSDIFYKSTFHHFISIILNRPDFYSIISIEYSAFAEYSYTEFLDDFI